MSITILNKTEIIEHIDLNKIWNCFATLTNEDDYWFTHGQFDTHVYMLDGNCTFEVYPIVNGETDTTDWVLDISDLSAEQVDNAYRNSLTCDGCGGEIDYCECDVGKEQWHSFKE